MFEVQLVSDLRIIGEVRKVLEGDGGGEPLKI